MAPARFTNAVTRAAGGAPATRRFRRGRRWSTRPGRLLGRQSSAIGQAGRLIPRSREIDASPLRATAITSRRNSGGNGLGTMLILPARPQPHPKESTEPGAVPYDETTACQARPVKPPPLDRLRR
jgi:hypothetical protein